MKSLNDMRFYVSEASDDNTQRFNEAIDNFLNSKTKEDKKNALINIIADNNTAIQNWIIEEYSKTVQEWVISEFAEEVQKWCCNELVPTTKDWIVEYFIPKFKYEFMNKFLKRSVDTPSFSDFSKVE